MVKRNVLLCIICILPIVLVRDSFHENNNSSFSVNLEYDEYIYKQRNNIKESLYLEDNFENDTLKIETYTKRHLMGIPR